MWASNVTLSASFQIFFFRWASPDLIVIAQNDVSFDAQSYHGTVFKTGKKWIINLSLLSRFPEKEGDSVKSNLAIVEKISRFIRGLTAEDTNSKISQNRVPLCAFTIALNPSESLPDLK